jgi:hypothetical protein
MNGDEIEYPKREPPSQINSQQKIEKKDNTPRAPKLIGVVLFIIIMLIIFIILYLYNPICDFQKIGGKYPSGDDCNVCLCTIKGFICTELECEDLEGDALSEFKELCEWNPGECDQECSYDDSRYFYISEIGSCEEWKSGNCCSPPPFDTVEECILICEN